MKHLPLIALAGLLAACDGQTIVEHRVENASTRTVRMVFHADAFNRFIGDTLVMAPGTFTRVAWNDLLGGRRDYRRPAEGIDSVYVEVDGGGSLTRDLLSDEAWAVDSKGKGIKGSFSHVCTFRFTDADID
ncbi:MAG: hypothetical protein KDB75_00275 [Flavobacteriales bacterium]|nr:hypothetical protein [Flavobacteriales bacterium]